VKRAPRHRSSRGFNRQSVQAALRSLISKLGSYKTVPHHGLALFCGYGEDDEGKQKKLVAVFEPMHPLVSGMYRCDSKFHTEILREQLDDQRTFGFIIIDGETSSFHTLTGNSKQTLFKLDVSLPKKHGRGGQSKNRFARIRDEKRGWYTSKVAALATKYFINPVVSLPNVVGLVIAGSAQLKDDTIPKLDSRLAKIVVAVVDVQYGGDSGFHQAINLTQGNLTDLKFVHEQQIVSQFFEEISKNGKYCIGIDDVMYALTSGLMEKLILWENLAHIRLEVQLISSPEVKKIVYLRPDEKLNSDWAVISSVPVIDWILENYKLFGVAVELISDESDVGNQFVRGLGGIGGFLRYEVDLPSTTAVLDEEEEEFVW
jgi:peptide chain release factor subunit 1